MSLSVAIQVNALDAMPGPLAEGARVVLQAKPTFWTQRGSLMLDAPFIYQAHVTVAWLLFAVWPFTRLVHVWSVPIGYVVRSPIVYRAKRGASRTALR